MSHIHVEHDAAHELHDYSTDHYGNIHHKSSQGWKAATPEFPDLVMYGDSPEEARANMEWRIRVEVIKQEFS